MALLPGDVYEFLICPPHFKTMDDNLLEQIRGEFKSVLDRAGDYHTGLQRVLNFCYASIVYQIKHGLEARTASAGNIIRELRIWSLVRMENYPEIVCTSDESRIPFKTTGADRSMEQQKRVRDELRAIGERVCDASEKVSKEVNANIEKMVEDYNIARGGLTTTLLKTAVKEAVDFCLDARGYSEASIPATSHSEGEDITELNQAMYCWGGGFKLIPKDFALPGTFSFLLVLLLYCFFFVRASGYYVF